MRTGPPKVTVLGISTAPATKRRFLSLSSRLRKPKPVRTVFLIDGLNLHHSVLAIARAFPSSAVSQWMDIRAFCNEHLSIISPEAVTCGVQYFFTFAEHLENAHPGLLAAHQDHIDALCANGVTVQFGRFKGKRVWCPECKKASFRYEEKETDVAIAATMIKLAVTKACDAIVIVSGDTDLIPAIRIAKELAPEIAIWAAFPFGRRNRELAHVADGSFKFTHDQYIQHQFPPSVTLQDGRVVKRPAGW